MNLSFMQLFFKAIDLVSSYNHPFLGVVNISNAPIDHAFRDCHLKFIASKNAYILGVVYMIKPNLKSIFRRDL